MRSKAIRYIVLSCALVLSIDANATLINRGNGMIYDDSTNLTWLQDVNYARTIGFKGTLLRDEWGRTQPSVDQNGHMTWSEAMRFASELTYGGYDNWRLPKQGTGPVVWEDRHSELAVLFYSSLGNEGAFINGVYNQNPYGLLNNGPFAFGNATTFWTSDTDRYGDAWLFDMNGGYSGSTDRTSIYNHFAAWAVRDGDVASDVPEPSSIALLSAALVGLGFTRRCKT